MTDVLDVQLAIEHGLPFFVTRNTDPELERVYGYTKRGRTGLVTFPAFLPFVDYVIQDLRTVYGERLAWTAPAEAFLEALPERRRAREQGALPDGFEFVTEPFAHQREDVIRGFHEPRFGLFFDCGLGKTKTAVDLIRAVKLAEPDTKVLVMCPPHLPRNWVREFVTHGDGTLAVLHLLDANNKTVSPERRLEVYTGERSVEPNPSLWPYILSPDLLYEPLEPPTRRNETWEELLDLEKAYCRAVIADDAKERSRVRSRMRSRAKKLGVELPAGARMLDPRPTPARDYDVIILPYSILHSDVDLIRANIPYTMIVCDESHAFRSTSSNRSKAALTLMQGAGRRYLLTGTPSLGHPMHLYTQLRMLGEHLIEGWRPFRRRYLVSKKMRVPRSQDKHYDMVVAYKNLDLLNEIVTLVASRRKAEDCLDLPPVRVISYPVDVGENTKKIYNELVRSFATTLLGERIRVAHAADRLTKLIQVLGGFIVDSGKNYELCDECPHLMTCVARNIGPYTPACKVAPTAPPSELVRTGDTSRRDHCVGLVDSILATEGSKVIVWCVYTEELNMLEEEFKRMDFGYVRVDGSTKDKVAAEDAFQQDPECRVYLAQIATGVGITLTAANYTVYYGVSMDLEHYEQSKKRNDRIGQTRPVTIYHLETPGSLNENIFRLLREKQNVSDTLTDHVRCMLCDRFTECREQHVSPFDDACLYSTRKSKVSLRPAYLK